MKPSNKELNDILDRATAEIRSERVDPSVVEGAAERVWAKLSNEPATASAPAAHVEHIRNCDDFQKLIPAYLSGSLSPARSLLFEDHTHECIPCRKALKEARYGVAAVPARAWRVEDFGFAPHGCEMGNRRYDHRRNRRSVVDLRSLLQRGGDAFNMVVHAMDGQAYLVSDANTQGLAVGQEIKPGDKVRTAKDAGAVVKLPDGTLIEMRERSEFSVTDSPQGTTIHLDRGNIIVQAAKQTQLRHLYVQTDDCLVSVIGTVFSVNNGTKGSRVSVVEGEVHVEHGGKQDVLHPGDQVATTASIERVPVKDEIAWSRDAARYKQMLAESAQRNRRASSPARREVFDSVARHDAGRHGLLCRDSEPDRDVGGIEQDHPGAIGSEPRAKPVVGQGAGFVAGQTAVEQGRLEDRRVRRANWRRDSCDRAAVEHGQGRAGWPAGVDHAKESGFLPLICRRSVVVIEPGLEESSGRSIRR